ncbi:hypothetical protein FN846DRAFT_898610 [Sphaerosporella brunnea]|uniref:Uncharacterized protein n=1 Tax=Sphaerosporella brunnea TaxID=1250544 RepID=A0A5J5EYS3_9PEZI|nr:hypothetical protein FN846DRAFT_898610 [Sphaerosporella brunnea]
MFSYIKNLKPGKKQGSPAPADATTTAAATETKPEPILNPDDEHFLQSQLEATDEPTVIFPGSEATSGTVTPAVAEAAAEAEAETAQEKAKEKEEWKDLLATRWDGLKRSVSSAADKRKQKATEETAKKEEKKKLKEKEKEKEKKKKEQERPEDELVAVLEQLNLAAEDGCAFSLSTETKALLQRFTQILKDISVGVPTAYQDLIDLLDSSSTQLEQTYTGLPSFLQKLIKTLPEKLKPEILRAATAASPALVTEGGLGLKELITKPGMLMGLLKSVVNFLKTRFPAAALGGNVALSLALFVVLLVLWYFYKRGKEVRLEAEEKERIAKAGLQEAEAAAADAATKTNTEADLQGGSKY